MSLCLHCLRMSHEKDDWLIWVKTVSSAHACLQIIMLNMDLKKITRMCPFIELLQISQLEILTFSHIAL